MRHVTIALFSAVLLAGCCGRSPCCPPPCVAAAPPPVGAPAPSAVATASPTNREPARPDPSKAGVEPTPTQPSASLPAAPSGSSPRLRALALGAKTTSRAFSGYAQVSLENRTSMTLDLYVDGAYGCRALRNLFCTTQVRPGGLTLEARGPNGESATATTTLGAGDSVTWTVTEE